MTSRALTWGELSPAEHAAIQTCLDNLKDALPMPLTKHEEHTAYQLADEIVADIHRMLAAYPPRHTRELRGDH
jgi:hypothetical protein